MTAKCGTGSNEPRFSMNRAVKFTMGALMMLGILTGTDASPTIISVNAAPPVCKNMTLQLDLSYQNLTELPDLSSCMNLEILNLEGNKLTTLPEEIGEIITLKSLCAIAQTCCICMSTTIRC